TPSNFPISLLPTTASTLLHEPTLDHGVHAFVAVDELRHAGRRPFGLFQEALSLSGVWWRRGGPPYYRPRRVVAVPVTVARSAVPESKVCRSGPTFVRMTV